MPTVLINFLFYNASSKIYTWNKKSTEPRLIYKKEKIKKVEIKKEETLYLTSSKAKSLIKKYKIEKITLSGAEQDNIQLQIVQLGSLFE